MEYFTIRIKKPSYRGNRVKKLPPLLSGRQLDGGLDESAEIIVELWKVEPYFCISKSGKTQMPPSCTAESCEEFIGF